MHKNTRFGEYDFVRYFFRKLLLFRYIWCIIRVERYPGGGIRHVIHRVRDCAEPVRVDLQSFRAAQHRGCVCSVLAHDSQGTSCASHMRQHVCACITSDRSKTRNRPEWRFATGRCGHRPLRGVYGCTHVRNFLETPIRFFLLPSAILQSSGSPCKNPNKTKTPGSSEPREIQKG